MVTLKDTIFNISSSRNQRFLKAQKVLKKVLPILISKYNVRKIILIGSLVDKHRFGFHSDIDLCVEWLSDKLYFQSVGELLLEADDFDIDIIPYETLKPEMRDQIVKGKILYEKK